MRSRVKQTKTDFDEIQSHLGQEICRVTSARLSKREANHHPISDHLYQLLPPGTLQQARHSFRGTIETLVDIEGNGQQRLAVPTISSGRSGRTNS
jgi:hypothetical protein